LNPVKNRLSGDRAAACSEGGRSSTAHNAGVSVNATIPESTTAIAIVMANCRYIRPVMPPRKATGTNTEHSTSTIAIRARLTWRMARSAATAGDTP